MPSVRTVGWFSTETTGLNWCPSVNRKFPESDEGDQPVPLRRSGQRGSLGSRLVYRPFVRLSAFMIRSFGSSIVRLSLSRPLSWLESLGLINY